MLQQEHIFLSEPSAQTSPVSDLFLSITEILLQTLRNAAQQWSDLGNQCELELLKNHKLGKIKAEVDDIILSKHFECFDEQTQHNQGGWNGDQSVISRLTEGFSLRLQTLSQLLVAERVPGPDTGPTSAAHSSTEERHGAGRRQFNNSARLQSSGDTVGNVVEPRFLLMVSNLAFS